LDLVAERNRIKSLITVSSLTHKSCMWLNCYVTTTTLV